MGFFKDFKADLSKAVEELIPDEEIEDKAPKGKVPEALAQEPIMVDTITDDDAEADCVYRPGVNCSDRSRCDRCGWNPEIEHRRKVKIRGEIRRRT